MKRSITLLVALLIAAPALQAAQPNIVVILADDMGYGDVAALNPQSQIPTPNLDRLAQQGMTFTDAHTPSAVCTPTRYGLLTGRYCWRTRLKSGVLNGYGEPLISPDRPTIATFLGSHGYRTGIVGKWHLGLGFVKQQDEFDYTQPVTDGPNDHGFDHSFIIPASLDFPPYVYLQDGRVTGLPLEHQDAQKFPGFLRAGPRGSNLVMADCLDRLTNEAVAFIESGAAAEEPFFLYFPLTAPHKPVLPHERFEGKTGLGPYGDFITQVDWTVGEVLTALETADVADDTLVIYTSDNGSFMFRQEQTDRPDHVVDHTVQAYDPAHHTANGPLRGTKADIWEAGHRVPFFVRWPGTVEAGSRCDETICLTDVFATVADVVEQQPPKAAAPDSYSFLPLLKGLSRSEQRPPVIHHSVAGMFAVRRGPWKLVLGNGSGGRERPRGKPFERPYQLFHLGRDPGEEQNLIDQKPQIARQLEEAVEQIRQQEAE